MSDVKNPAEELERGDEQAEAEAAEEVAAVEESEPAAEASEEAPQIVLDLPEGANLMQMLIEAQMETQKAQGEVEVKQDALLRARAEFANYKKRTERESRETYQRAAHETLGDLLSIIDDFERAVGSVPAQIGEDAWFSGVEMIQRKFMNLLEKHELEAIDPTGEAFDPSVHQAIGAEDSDEVESGHVIETLQKGYRAGDKVLRLAMVRVAS